MRSRSCPSLFLTLILCIAALVTPVLAQTPVSWWKADGNTLDSTGGSNGMLQGGVGYAASIETQAFAFNGIDGVVHIPDSNPLKFTGSLSITAHVYAKAVGAEPDGSQIFFRGDDRPGYDPYFLDLHPDGTVTFAVGDASNAQGSVRSYAPLPLNQWISITASLDAVSGQLSLYFNSQRVGQSVTAIRPFRNLNSSQNPGVAIGNTQNPAVFNQPFFGLIDEVKVYNTVITPTLWSAVDLQSGPDGNSHVLWNRPDGAMTLWTVPADGTNPLLGPAYGPIAGWTAKSLSVDFNNTVSVLWTNTDGRMTVWTFPADGTGPTYSPVFGPFAEWTAVRVTSGVDNLAHVLWANTDGRITLWTVPADGSPAAYGPFLNPPAAGFTAADLSEGVNGNMHVLWNRVEPIDDGMGGTIPGGGAILWTLDASSQLVGIVSGFGPYQDWSANRISSSPDGSTHLLWNNVDGRATLWTLDANNNFVGMFPIYGPYTGWQAQTFTIDTNGNTRLLWDNDDGRMTLWTVNANGSTPAYSPYYGPY